ncbi:hypothetical protein BSKO_06633 [Bryopsis sp. KO-2023]|nr:hypothetical protein BSKO_06633 [Bryopsis sp. KO-2023]
MRGPSRLVELPKLDESLIVETDLQPSLTSSGYPPDRTRTLFQGNARFDALRTDDAVKLWDRGYPFAAVRKKLKSGSEVFAVHRISVERKSCFWEVIKKGEDTFCFRSPKAGGRFLTSRWSKGKKSFYLAAIELNETLQDFWRLKQIARTGYVKIDFLFQNAHWKEHEMMIEIERHGMFGPFRNLGPIEEMEHACSPESSMYSCPPPEESLCSKEEIAALKDKNYVLDSENVRLKHELALLKQELLCKDSEVCGKQGSPLREVQHQERVFPADRATSTQTYPDEHVEKKDAQGAESKINQRSAQLDEKEQRLNVSISELKAHEEDLKRRLAAFNSKIEKAKSFEIALHERERKVTAKEAWINKWKGSIDGEVSALKSGLNQAALQFDARFHTEMHAFRKIVVDAFRDDQRKRKERSARGFERTRGERIMKEISSLRHAFQEVRSEVEFSIQARESALAETKSSLLRQAESADAKNADVKILTGKLSKVQNEFKECHKDLTEEFQSRFENFVGPLSELKSKFEECVLAQATKKKETREKCTQAAGNIEEVRKDMKSLRQEMTSELGKMRGFLKGIAQTLGEKAFNLELERQKFAEECKRSQAAFQMKAEVIAAEAARIKATNERMRKDLMLESESCKRSAQQIIREAVEQTIVERKKHMKAELAEYHCEVKKLREDMRNIKSEFSKEHDSIQQQLDFVSEEQKTICIQVAAQDAIDGEEALLGVVFDKWEDLTEREAQHQQEDVEEDPDILDCEEMLRR